MPKNTLFLSDSYLLISHRASATVWRGLLMCSRRLGCSMARQRFHCVTQPAWITGGEPRRIALMRASSHRLMAWSRICGKRGQCFFNIFSLSIFPTSFLTIYHMFLLSFQHLSSVLISFLSLNICSN